MCPKCCLKSSCRSQAPTLLETLVKPRSDPQCCTNIERGLYPSFPKPTQTLEVSHRRKLLCQSSQEQLPVRGITSAYGQKCSGNSPKPDISRFFQPHILGPKTQQQVETYLGPEQIKSLPQGGKLQNGDTGNHQDIPPTRRVGNVHRLQGRLLPHTHTGTVPEILEISRPGQDIPVQSPSFRALNSTHGVHCNSQRGKANGNTQGYKDPPVPRRLAGESPFLPGLPPTHSRTCTIMSKFRLAGEFGKIGVGAQAGFQLRRLPVRPQFRSGPTDTGPVAQPTRENFKHNLPTDLSGPRIYVPDRFAHCHREASSSWPVTHETHSVASQK